MMKLFAFAFLSLTFTSGCTVARVAGAAASTTAKVGVGTVKTTAKAGGAVADAATPDRKDDEKRD